MLIKIGVQEAAKMMQNDSLLEKVFIRRKINDQVIFYMANSIRWYFGKTTDPSLRFDGKLNFNTAEFYKEIDDDKILSKQKAEYDRGLEEGFKLAQDKEKEIEKFQDFVEDTFG